jgi:hypothetical protein
MTYVRFVSPATPARSKDAAQVVVTPALERGAVADAAAVVRPPHLRPRPLLEPRRPLREAARMSPTAATISRMIADIPPGDDHEAADDPAFGRFLGKIAP